MGGHFSVKRLWISLMHIHFILGTEYFNPLHASGMPDTSGSVPMVIVTWVGLKFNMRHEGDTYAVSTMFSVSVVVCLVSLEDSSSPFTGKSSPCLFAGRKSSIVGVSKFFDAIRRLNSVSTAQAGKVLHMFTVCFTWSTTTQAVVVQLSQ